MATKQERGDALASSIEAQRNSAMAAVPVLVTRSETFTPDRARAILSGQQNVRVMHRPHVAFLAKQMTGGLWANNGETIKFGVHGRLVDGQHRLAAIVESGCTISMLCVYGATEVGVDEGRRRCFGDLVVGGRRFGLMESAIVRADRWMSAGLDPWVTTESLSNRDMADHFETMDIGRFGAAVVVAKEARRALIGSVVGLVHYLASKNGAGAMVSKFFRSVASGADLREGSPELMLKRWFDGNRAKTGHSNSQWTRAKFVACTRAWNLRVSGGHAAGQSLWSNIHNVALPMVAAPAGSEEAAS